MMYDIVIKNATILTMNSKMEVIKNGCIAIKDEHIVFIGNDFSNWEAKKIFNAHDKLVLPGFINTHTHAAMTLFRGLADDLPLKTWLEDYIWPAEAKYMNPENVAVGTKLGLIEMLKSGTTTFNDMYFYEDVVGEITSDFGMRAILGEGIIHFPTPNSKSVKDSIEYTLKLLKKWQNHPLISVSFAPHAPYTVPKEFWREIDALAKQENTLIHTHIAETSGENQMIPENDCETPIQYLEKAGFLHDRVIAAHCIHLNDKDIEICKKRNIGIAHNPASNMKLASGVAPLSKWNHLNKISLGTDGATSNNNLSMLKEMNLCALLHKIHNNDPKIAPAEKMVEMATIGGAKALRKEKEIGSLEIGKKADIQILSLEKAHCAPFYHPYSYLVYAAHSEDVETVIINGKIIMENREFLEIDEDKIIAEAKEAGKKIKLP
jgi:5-methylthioadenosine/S-adenosylhomocysteine deaminase